MRLAEIIATLETRGAPLDDTRAIAGARASLHALSAFIPATDKPALRAVLPDELADALDQPYAGPGPSRAELVEQLAREVGMPEGRALELAEVVYESLAGALSADARQRIVRHLPDDVGSLLTPRSTEHGPAARARPPHVQSGSVAAWDGSRDDGTLGGYAGDPRAREGETLATGAPGSEHGVSEASEREGETLATNEPGREGRD
ncbi:MAG: DUF2267 domain-containing protein [Myxococcales bacterium]|jgi:uncharacterized protein (DUF2267 family)